MPHHTDARRRRAGRRASSRPGGRAVGRTTEIKSSHRGPNMGERSADGPQAFPGTGPVYSDFQVASITSGLVTGVCVWITGDPRNWGKLGVVRISLRIVRDWDSSEYGRERRPRHFGRFRTMFSVRSHGHVDRGRRGRGPGYAVGSMPSITNKFRDVGYRRWVVAPLGDGLSWRGLGRSVAEQFLSPPRGFVQGAHTNGVGRSSD